MHPQAAQLATSVQDALSLDFRISFLIGRSTSIFYGAESACLISVFRRCDADHAVVIRTLVTKLPLTPVRRIKSVEITGQSTVFACITCV